MCAMRLQIPVRPGNKGGEMKGFFSNRGKDHVTVLFLQVFALEKRNGKIGEWKIGLHKAHINLKQVQWDCEDHF